MENAQTSNTPCPSSVPSVSPPLIVQDVVSRRAYLKWLSREGTHDHCLKDWLDAEVEVAREFELVQQLSNANKDLSDLLAEKTELEKRLSVEHAISGILALADSLEAAAAELLQALGKCFGWDVGVLWLLDRKENLLQCVEVWHSSSIQISKFEHDSRDRTYEKGVGLPGCIWEQKSYSWCSDIIPVSFVQFFTRICGLEQ